MWSSINGDYKLGAGCSYTPSFLLEVLGTLPPVNGIPVVPDTAGGGQKPSPLVEMLYKSAGVELSTKMGVSKPNMFSSCWHTSKYDRLPQLDLNAEDEEIADRMWSRFLAPYVTGWKELCDEEIMHEMVLDSSPGFPYKELGFKDRGAVLSDARGMLSIRAYIDALEKGEAAPCVWQSFTKTELLKEKKFVPGHYRGILNVPTHLYFAQVKYLGDFNNRIKHACKVRQGSPPGLGMALGFTPFYGGMQDIASSKPDGWVVSESDLKEFDSSREKRFHMKEFQLRAATYGGSNPNMEKILYRLYQEETCTVFVAENGQVFRKQSGQCSGSYITSLSNTIGRLWYLMYAWVRLARRKVIRSGESDLDAFRRTVRWWLLGDDEFLYIHPDIAAEFSVEKRSALLERECGLFTEVETADSLSLAGHHFLGWEFQLVDGVYRPTFSAERVLQSLLRPIGSQKDQMVPVRLVQLAVLLHYHRKDGASVLEVLRSIWDHISKTEPSLLEGLVFPNQAFLDELWGSDEAGVRTHKTIVPAKTEDGRSECFFVSVKQEGREAAGRPREGRRNEA